MRTPKILYLDERIIYKPELSSCPHCEGPLEMCDYLLWDKTVQTVDAVLSIASRLASCADPRCLGHTVRFVSAEGQQIAPRGYTYGYDVLAHIGWLRQERRDAYAEIQAELAGKVQVSESHVRTSQCSVRQTPRDMARSSCHLDGVTFAVLHVMRARLLAFDTRRKE